MKYLISNNIHVWKNLGDEWSSSKDTIIVMTFILWTCSVCKLNTQSRLW